MPLVDCDLSPSCILNNSFPLADEITDFDPSASQVSASDQLSGWLTDGAKEDDCLDSPGPFLSASEPIS